MKLVQNVGLFLWRRKLLLAGFVVVLVGGLWWWQGQDEKGEVINTVHPQFRNIEETLDISGYVNALTIAKLSFPSASRLTWVGVNVGDMVNKWQALAKVDTRSLEKQMQIDLNTHGKIFRQFESTLDENDVYSESGLTEEERRTVESAQLDVRNSALGVEIRDLAIRLSTLSSPIAGLVTRVDQPNPGTTVFPTDLIEVVDPNSIYFASVVDEEDIAKVAEGQAVKLHFDAYADEEIFATIGWIGFSAKATEGGGTGYELRVTLPVENGNLRYKLGMNGEGAIVLNVRNGVLSIPLDALISREDGEFVEVKRGEEVDLVAIKTGIESEDYIEIIEGLTVDDAVVVPTNNE